MGYLGYEMNVAGKKTIYWKFLALIEVLARKLYGFSKGCNFVNNKVKHYLLKQVAFANLDCFISHSDLDLLVNIRQPLHCLWKQNYEGKNTRKTRPFRLFLRKSRNGLFFYITLPDIQSYLEHCISIYLHMVQLYH